MAQVAKKSDRHPPLPTEAQQDDGTCTVLSCISDHCFRDKVVRETLLVKNQLAEFTKHCQHVANTIQAADATKRRDEDLASLIEIAKTDCMRIQLDARERAARFRSMAAHDHDGQSEWLENMLQKHPWSTCHRGGSVAVSLFSDIHESVRRLDEGESGTSKVWTAPQTFVRETHKYWVEEERLEEVLLACTAEAPLLVYGSR